MDYLDLLRRRRSTPSRLLAEPGPSPEQLDALLTLAVRVPDHGKLTPWRFLRIAGDARQVLGEMLAQRHQERDPDAAPAVIEKDRLRFSHAPVIIAVISRITADHKVPEIEQQLSAGAVCFSLLLGAEAMGFGAQWLTSWAAYDPIIATKLGLASNEHIAGFIHMGTASETAPERQRPDSRTLTRDWQP